jgi:hypothetical protein
MAQVFKSTKLADYTKWRPIFDADVARRDRVGFRQIGVFQEAGNLNELVLVWETDKSAAEARSIVNQMMADPELGVLMQKSGVQGMPKVWVAD